MTVFSSSMISQQIASQTAMMSGNAAYAQQLSYPMQSATNPGMQAPPPMVAPTPFALQRHDYSGVGYGAASAGVAGMGAVAGGLSLAGSMGMLGSAGRFLDPFTTVGRAFGGASGMSRAYGAASAGLSGAHGVATGMRGAMGAMTMGGVGAGALAAAGAALPFYAASKVADVYGGAFMGGAREHGQLSNTMGNNFNFLGGQGQMGRGFSEGQVGQIGGMINNTLRDSPMSSFGEMNSLISGGAQAGMFTGVRDVKEFGDKFKKMLTTLKSVQQELGGTLTNALEFVQQSKSSGVFSAMDRSHFAGAVRNAMTTSGFNQGEVMALTQQGSQISRAFGGTGRQGAIGAARSVGTLGAAMTEGIVNEAELSEATGGLTGNAAMSSFVTNMMERTGRFSRRSSGRYTAFGLSNSDGTGIDPVMLARLQAGDLDPGDIAAAAHRNVGSMGRARAMQQEGRLRGSLMEQGGISAQLGLLRGAIGERVLDSGDERASLFIQRRMGVSREQSDILMNMLKNQGQIAEREAMDQVSARRQTSLEQDITQNRSADALLQGFSQGISDEMGVTAMKESGSRFASEISDAADKFVRRLTGTTVNALTEADNRTLNRAAMGRSTAADNARMDLLRQGRGFADISGSDLMRSSSLNARSTLGDRLARRGVDYEGMTGTELRDAVGDASDAQMGIVRGGDLERLAGYMKDVSGTNVSVADAQLRSHRIYGDSRAAASISGMGANVYDAFRVQSGGEVSTPRIDEGELLNIGGGGDQSVSSAALMFHDDMMGGAPISGTVEAWRADERADSGRTQEATSTWEHMADVAAATAVGGLIAGPVGAAIGLTAGLIGVAYGVHDDALNAENITADNFTATMHSEDVKERMLEVAAASNPAALNAALDNLATASIGMEDGDPAKAGLLSMHKTLRDSVQDGQLPAEMRSRVLGTAAGSQRVRQARQRLGEISRSTRVMSANLEMEFEGMGLMDAGGSEILAQVNASAAAFAAGDGRAGSAGMSALRERLVTADDGDKLVESMHAGLGGSAEGRAFLASTVRERAHRRSLTGEGRRGGTSSNRSVSTALADMTGGTFGDMTFSVAGNRNNVGGSRTRNVSTNQALRMVMQGGARGDEILEQIQKQASTSGADISGVMSAYERFRGDGEGAGDAAAFTSAVENDEGVKRMRQAAQEERAASAAASDPLGTARNTILEAIRDRMPAVAAAAPTGGPGSSTPGGPANMSISTTDPP